MMDYHKQGLDSIEFFKQKYGAVEADERKKFINTMFGLLNQKEQAVLNPMLLEDGIKSKDNVYRTYRADRVSKAVPMAPEEYAAMPFSYEAVSQVRMPEAQRAMPEGEQGGDVTLTRLREIRDGLDENLTEREAIDELDFIINDAPSGYFPQDILNKVDQAKRDLEEEFTTWAGRGDSEASTESAISSVMSFLDSKESRGEAAPSRFMPEGISPEDLNPVANKQEAQGLWADGKRMFALNEMDEKLTPITSKAMLDSYSADAIGWMEPEAPTRFMPEKLDSDYMKAVESGDVEAQQRMVDEVAKRAGYDSENIAYHGTNVDFNNFDVSDKIGVWTGSESVASLFSRIKSSREGGTPRVIKAYLKAQNPATVGYDVSVSGDKAAKQREKLISEGYDSIESKGNFRIVFDPSQIKSADPITRDDSGNVIPLSKRFDVGSRDMRFMPEGDVEVKVVDRPDETTEQGTPAPDSDVQSLPLTGNPIPWDRMLSRQVRFMPESDRNAFPTMTPKLLAEIEKETPTLAAIHIDRMRVGEYMGIDLQGGMFYPTIKENLDSGVVWAFNSTGVARTVANRAAQNKGYVKLVLMQEGNVVGNKTFANIWFKILSDSVENKQISKALALTELNAARRTVYKTLEGKDIKKNPWVTKHADKWNSLEEAKEAILSMPQIERGATYFKKSKTTTKSEGEKIAYQALLSQKMAKLGFPDARKIVNDIEEPAFKGIPTGAAVAIIKFDPLGADEKIMTAKEAGVPEHMSYGYVLKGKPVAKLGYYQVVEETFPKTKGQIMTQQHTDFPIRASVPSKKSARGQIQYASAIANAAKLK
jgi:hypothetical protein